MASARLMSCKMRRLLVMREWWKLREAALLAVGAVADPLLEAPGSSDRDFDLASFLNSCLAEDLSATLSALPARAGSLGCLAVRHTGTLRPNVTFLKRRLCCIYCHIAEGKTSSNVQS